MDRQFLINFTFFNSLTTNEAAPLMNRTFLNELHQACLYPQTWERLFFLPILIPLHIAWRFFFIGFSIPCTSDQLFDFFFCIMERRRVEKKSYGGVGFVKLSWIISSASRLATRSGDETGSSACLGGSCF